MSKGYDRDRGNFAENVLEMGRGVTKDGVVVHQGSLITKANIDYLNDLYSGRPIIDDNLESSEIQDVNEEENDKSWFEAIKNPNSPMIITEVATADGGLLK